MIKTKEQIRAEIEKDLTPTEYEVFKGMIEGDSVKRTAEDFAISIADAQAHRRFVYEFMSGYTDLSCGGTQKQAALINWWNSLPNAGNEIPIEPKENEPAIENFSGQFFVFNPTHGQPRKVYGSYDKALLDAKDVAKKSLQNVFVLQIMTLCIPHVEVEIVDKTVPCDDFISEDEIPF